MSSLTAIIMGPQIQPGHEPVAVVGVSEEEVEAQQRMWAWEQDQKLKRFVEAQKLEQVPWWQCAMQAVGAAISVLLMIAAIPALMFALGYMFPEVTP